jgi:formamidopyrimidine-DNA glycosylase
MPELPEVETVRRIMERVLVGHTIVDAEILPDPIMMFGVPPERIKHALEGRKVTGIGRKGKYWWIEFEDKPWLVGHLGMSGWIRELGASTIRLREHGQAPLDDEAGRPRFLKMLLTTEAGGKISFTDGRRLGRLWLTDDIENDAKMEKLGPDAWKNLPKDKPLFEILQKRKAPLKALLLDQKLFAGVGNWIADEALYQSRLSPKRLGNTLTQKEVSRLRSAIEEIITKAVEVGADKDQFPVDWLFQHRWGGSKGAEFIAGNPIIREQVGGRTTAWVPKVQK